MADLKNFKYSIILMLFGIFLFIIASLMDDSIVQDCELKGGTIHRDYYGKYVDYTCLTDDGRVIP